MLELLAMEYEMLNKQVKAAGLEYKLSEIHGLATGMICAGIEEYSARWYELLFADAEPGDLLADECKQGLALVLEQIEAELKGGESQLVLLLPDDEQPWTDRAAAISEWCQGFLFGFGLAGERTETSMSAEIREALRDFTEISRLDADGVEEGDVDESLVELEEYIWVAVTLIYHEVGSNNEC